MTHSPEHMRQKAAARAEAMDHMKSNVINPRNNMDHEDHKFAAPSHSVDGRPDEFRGKGMTSNPDASRTDKTSYKTKIGESC